MSNYLKKITANDLGFRNGNKKQSAYILLSTSMIGDFFPTFQGSLEIDVDFFDIPDNPQKVWLRTRIKKGTDGRKDQILLYLVIEPFYKTLGLSAENIIIIKKIANDKYEFSRLNATHPDYQEKLAILGKKNSVIRPGLTPY